MTNVWTPFPCDLQTAFLFSSSLIALPETLHIFLLNHRLSLYLHRGYQIIIVIRFSLSLCYEHQTVAQSLTDMKWCLSTGLQLRHRQRWMLYTKILVFLKVYPLSPANSQRHIAQGSGEISRTWVAAQFAKENFLLSRKKASADISISLKSLGQTTQNGFRQETKEFFF